MRFLICAGLTLMLFTTALDAALWQVAGERTRLQAKVRAQAYELAELKAKNDELRVETALMRKKVVASTELFKARVRVAAMRKAVAAPEMTAAAIEASQKELKAALTRAEAKLQKVEATRKRANR